MATLDELRPKDRVYAAPAEQWGTIKRILPRPERRNYPIVVRLDNDVERRFAPEELERAR